MRKSENPLPMMRMMRVERGSVGRVEPAYTNYSDGTRSVEPSGLVVHWQPAGSRGEHEQFLSAAWLEEIGGFEPHPGDDVFVLTNLRGTLVLAVVVADRVCWHCLPVENDDVLALAKNPNAVNGALVQEPRPDHR